MALRRFRHPVDIFLPLPVDSRQSVGLDGPILNRMGVMKHDTGCVDSMKVETGARLKLARLALKEVYGVSHAEFCRAMDITASALSNYETGTNLVSPRLLVRMKQKFGVTTDYVYTGSLEGLPKEVAKEILSGVELERQHILDDARATLVGAKGAPAPDGHSPVLRAVGRRAQHMTDRPR